MIIKDLAGLTRRIARFGGGYQARTIQAGWHAEKATRCFAGKKLGRQPTVRPEQGIEKRTGGMSANWNAGAPIEITKIQQFALLRSPHHQ